MGRISLYNFLYDNLDSIITNSIPHLPKWFAKPFSKPYVAGETVEEALSEIRHLNSKGLAQPLIF